MRHLYSIKELETSFKLEPKKFSINFVSTKKEKLSFSKYGKLSFLGFKITEDVGLSIISINKSFISGPFKNLCQSGKITNTKGETHEDRSRCRAICS